VEAFRATGADCLATPCAICKAQLPVAFEHYGVQATVSGVMDLLGKSIQL
jgi:heterodisulfide reductase subunit B